MNPICRICLCECEKWKITRKAGNICNVCKKNDAKVKRLAKMVNKRYYKNNVKIRRSLIAKNK
jgi:hypothetical protein